MEKEGGEVKGMLREGKKREVVGREVCAPCLQVLATPLKVSLV